MVCGGEGQGDARAIVLRGAWRVSTLAAVIACWSSAAEGKPEYAGILQERLGMGDCVPTCMVCHTVPEGGSANLNGFVVAPLSVVRASNDMPLPELKEDFDKDGKNDGDELKDGESPILPGSARICAPSYGCGARIAPPPRSFSASASLACVGALAFCARRAARRRAAGRDATEAEHPAAQSFFSERGGSQSRTAPGCPRRPL